MLDGVLVNGIYMTDNFNYINNVYMVTKKIKQYVSKKNKSRRKIHRLQTRKKYNQRKNKTRKLKGRGRGFFSFRKQQEEPIPLGEDTFEEINPVQEANALAREKYSETMGKEFVVGQYGQVLRDEDSKMEQARKDAESAVKESYGHQTWNDIQRHFPGKPKPIPHETIEDLSVILPQEFWEETIGNMKFKSPLERKLFMKTMFLDEKTFRLNAFLLKPEITTADIREKIKAAFDQLLPFEKRHYSKEIVEKIINRVFKKIERFTLFYQEQFKKNLTHFAIRYWKNPRLGDKNYNRVKNYVKDHFGERNWNIISKDFKSKIATLGKSGSSASSMRT